ncbi:UPF0187-domain-containing protein [Athelia psychrophila]|uniref:UPF0187-domain-containing protein n=1 Tax=Athelia psychrophila TaxID=1759441 RepID=A0A167UQ17_9AGAM|nr:UPF0187-domain-containing protein [Fibularhizoctonia sp. CBS 109695]
MDTAKPPFASWSMHKFRATVFNDIWPEVLFFSLVATMVVLVSELTPHSLGISNQMLTVLGTVLGLVISFRTSSAYERYQDGRKLWSNIMVASRNIAMMIWIHIPSSREVKGTKEMKPIVEIAIEKKSMINLVQAFSVATKHFLRSEPGIYYEDLYPLICFLPRYATLPPAPPHPEDVLPLWSSSALDDPAYASPDTKVEMSTTSIGDPEKTQTDEHAPSRRNHKKFAPHSVLPVVASDKPLRAARSPPASGIWDYFGFLRPLRPILRWIRGQRSSDLTMGGRKRKQPAVESNVPLEITLTLNTYLAWCQKENHLTPAIATGLVNNIGNLQDTFNNLERIRNTPLPFAYQAHLRISLWMYLFLLPFQVYTAFKWLTIPGTAFTSFLLLGFLHIGGEIENPFNYDENDLDLDHFCLMIQRELNQVCAHTSPLPSTFIYSEWNQPFAPADRRTAAEIVSDVEHEYHQSGPGVGLDSVRRTLLQSWRDVDLQTRREHYTSH